MTNRSDTLHDLRETLHALEARVQRMRLLVEEGNSTAVHALLTEQDSAVRDVQRQFAALDLQQRKEIRQSVLAMAVPMKQAYEELQSKLSEQKEQVVHQLSVIQQQQGIHARNIYDNP